MEARLNNLRKYHFEKLDTIYSQGVITLANFFSDDSAKLNLLFFQSEYHHNKTYQQVTKPKTLEQKFFMPKNVKVIPN